MNVTDNETTPVNETETGLNETDGLNETETEMPVTETENERQRDRRDGRERVRRGDERGSQGTEVTVNATLSEGGYVAVHDDSLLANATTLDLNEAVNSTIGASAYLEPGEHENVTITLFDVPGAEFDETELTESQFLVAMPHQETNDNETYDYVATNGTEDGPYTIDGEPIVAPTIYDAPDENETLIGFNESDDETTEVNETENETDGLNETETETEAGLNETEEDAGVGLNETTETDDSLNATDNETTPVTETENETDGLNETETETEAGLNETTDETETDAAGDTTTVTAQTAVTFENQTANVTEKGTAVTIETTTLSEGGYVAIHNESLLDGDAVGSVVGVSEYLEAGTYENLSVVLQRLRRRVRRHRTHGERDADRDAPTRRRTTTRRTTSSPRTGRQTGRTHRRGRRNRRQRHRRTADRRHGDRDRSARHPRRDPAAFIFRLAFQFQRRDRRSRLLRF